MKASWVQVRPKAFSLLELLLVIAVLAALMTLFYPVGQAVIERSRAASCVQRLREIGITLHSYSAENNGRLRLFRDGSALGSLRWYLQFKQHTGLSDAGAQKAFGCPSLPSKDVGDWYCYGMRVDGSPGRRVLESVTDAKGNVSKGGIYVLPVAAVESPSKFLMAADTLAVGDRQTFRIIPPLLYAGGGIQIRHQGKANALFLDGHVAALDPAGLYAAGIDEVLDHNKSPLRTKP